MRAWRVQDQWQIENLRQVEAPEPAPGAGQVVVRMRAASLNYRDLLTVQGKGAASALPLIPFSDGAGEVVGLGAGVTRVAIGDRVCPMFFPDWIAGGPTAEKRSRPLGGPAPGILQDEVLIDAEGVSRCPAHLSFTEAATLPCAALTAWRALVVEGNLQAGQTVLVQGTGGVSTFALQFAKMLGARVIVTSSSDDKLEKARTLGADHLINYRKQPNWGRAAVELTDGQGVDHVVEVGGAATVNQSLEAACVGGDILIIGVLSGFSQEIAMRSIYGKNLRLIGLSVGSREHFQAMTTAIERHQLRPVIDSVFPIEDVQAGLRRMQSGQHYGKICFEF